jgi:hypothetical protein
MDYYFILTACKYLTQMSSVCMSVCLSVYLSILSMALQPLWTLAAFLVS